MSLVYSFTVKDNGSVTLNKINTNVNILNQSLTKVDNTTNIFNKSLGLLQTAGASVVAMAFSKATSTLTSFSKEMVNSYDSASKLSANIGITAESVLGLRHAAELSAVGSEAMDQNMVKLSKTIAEAASGSKQASDAFGKMGISVNNFVPTPQKKCILESGGNYYDSFKWWFIHWFIYSIYWLDSREYRHLFRQKEIQKDDSRTAGGRSRRGNDNNRKAFLHGFKAFLYGSKELLYGFKKLLQRLNSYSGCLRSSHIQAEANLCQ
jgi:hypothetical protein